MSYEKLARINKKYHETWNKLAVAREKGKKEDIKTAEEEERKYYIKNISLGRTGNANKTYDLFQSYRNSIERDRNDILCISTLYYDDYKDCMFEALDYWEIKEFVYYNDSIHSSQIFSMFNDFCENGYKMEGMREVNIEGKKTPGVLFRRI